MEETGLPPATTSLTPNHNQPHPQPLSEWRGEWKPLFADKGGVFSNWRKALLDTKKRPLQNEEGVSLFLVLLFQLTRHSLATQKLYYTGILAQPYIKQN